MYDRIFAAIMLALSGWIIWTAAHFYVPFQYEPLGPKAFPIIIAAVLIVASLWLLVRPSANKWHPGGRVLIHLLVATVLLVFYALVYVPLGFIASTFIVGFAFSLLFGEKLLSAGIYSLALSIVGFYLMKTALELNVPTGTLFGG